MIIILTQVGGGDIGVNSETVVSIHPTKRNTTMIYFRNVDDYVEVQEDLVTIVNKFNKGQTCT